MSILAERKRKTKWVINPTKTPLWTQDCNGIKFGKELMEKMGWSVGKGLGLKEQGIEEPLRLSYKNDKKGMGFKGNNEDWIEHQDEFNMLLRQLSNNNNDPDVSENSEIKKSKSLEHKSKHSRARVHYQKFTRGKDLTYYSENDLACILGTNKKKNPDAKEKSKHEKVFEIKEKSEYETSFGVTTINSGSIEDYFKKKYFIHKIKSAGSCEAVEATENMNKSFCDLRSNFFLNEGNSEKPNAREKKSKKRKDKSEGDNDMIEKTGNLDKIYVNEQFDFPQNENKSEERKCKKRKLSKSRVEPFKVEGESGEHEVTQLGLSREKTEKKIRHETVETNFDEGKSKKKKKKRKVSVDECDNVNENKKQIYEAFEEGHGSPEDEFFSATLKEKNERKKRKHEKQNLMQETKEMIPEAAEKQAENEKSKLGKKNHKHKKHKTVLEAEEIDATDTKNQVKNKEYSFVKDKKSKHKKHKLVLQTEEIIPVLAKDLVEKEEAGFSKEKKLKKKKYKSDAESQALEVINADNNDISNKKSEKMNNEMEVKIIEKEVIEDKYGLKEPLKHDTYTKDRVLDLIRWADIKEFRGSNIGNVLGYGFKKQYLRNTVG